MSLGYHVLTVETKSEFMTKLTQERPDLVLIDRQIGQEDGFDLIQQVRKEGASRSIPIIIVTGSADLDKKVEAISLGADDLIHKPFSLKDLQVRIVANLRRSSSYQSDESFVHFEDIEINTRTHDVFLKTKPLFLTNTEYKIFYELVSKKGEILIREHIANRFLSLKNSNARTLDVHINSLRKKLGTYGGRVKTIRGRGYMLS